MGLLKVNKNYGLAHSANCNPCQIVIFTARVRSTREGNVFSVCQFIREGGEVGVRGYPNKNQGNPRPQPGPGQVPLPYHTPWLGPEQVPLCPTSTADHDQDGIHPHPTTMARTRTGYPHPPPKPGAGQGQDRPRAVRLLRSRRRTVLSTHVLKKYLPNLKTVLNGFNILTLACWWVNATSGHVHFQLNYPDGC